MISIDPQALLGSAIQGLIGFPILVGLPSDQAKIPNFVIGVMPREKFHSSISISGFQINAGDLFMKSAINPGEYSFPFVVTNNPSAAIGKAMPIIATALQALSATGNSLLSYGGVLPNLSGITSSFAGSQIATLHRIKNNAQPILLLNTFIPLGVIGQNNPNLSSNWYIESISGEKEQADQGLSVDITVVERLKQRNPSSGGLLTNLANELIGPGVGSAIGGLL